MIKLNHALSLHSVPGDFESRRCLLTLKFGMAVPQLLLRLRAGLRPPPPPRPPLPLQEFQLVSLSYLFLLPIARFLHCALF